MGPAGSLAGAGGLWGKHRLAGRWLDGGNDDEWLCADVVGKTFCTYTPRPVVLMQKEQLMGIGEQEQGSSSLREEGGEVLYLLLPNQPQFMDSEMNSNLCLVLDRLWESKAGSPIHTTLQLSSPRHPMSDCFPPDSAPVGAHPQFTLDYRHRAGNGVVS